MNVSLQLLNRRRGVAAVLPTVVDSISASVKINFMVEIIVSSTHVFGQQEQLIDIILIAEL